MHLRHLTSLIAVTLATRGHAATEPAALAARTASPAGATAAPPDFAAYVSTTLQHAFAPCCSDPQVTISPLLTLVQLSLMTVAILALSVWCRMDQPNAAWFTRRMRSIMARNPFDR